MRFPGVAGRSSEYNPMNAAYVIGILAALLTTASYFPQLRKSWRTRSTGDLSLPMFSILSAGVSLWVIYGLLRGDPVIIFANAVSLVCLLGIIYLRAVERSD